MSSLENDEFQLTEGVWIHTLDDDRILVVRCSTIQREAVDTLIVWLKERIEQWDAQKPWLAVYDLTLPGAMLTPYMRARVAEINDVRQEVKGRVAMIMRRDTTASLLSMFAMIRTHSSRQLRVWFHRADALVWLRELL